MVACYRQFRFLIKRKLGFLDLAAAAPVE